MGLLNVHQEQWNIAQQYFNLHADEKKLKKSVTHGFSFIKANGRLYAMANGLYIGEGGFSKVKMVENSRGENFVVKIEGKGFDKRAVNEVLVLKKLGKHIGVMERDLGEEKEFWKPIKGKSLKTTKKLYKIIKMEEGVDLNEALASHPTLTLTQKLIIGIRCCQVLTELHRQNVIHADIKPNNLRVVINGNKITLGAIDFGFSIIMPDGKAFMIDEAKGTRRYVAPEILAKGKFSFASDIFALGKMFEANLGFAPSLYEDMIKTNPNERSSLNHTQLKLVEALAEQPNLDEEAFHLINELKPKPVMRSQRPLPSPPIRVLPPTPAQLTFKFPSNAALPTPRKPYSSNPFVDSSLQERLNGELTARLAQRQRAK